MNRKKLKQFGAAVIAVICAALIFITGTYAFQIMTQQGWGRAVSRDQLPTGRLHIDQEVIGDNFGELNWYPGQSANNEIYVENFGDSIPILARVRLFEYMESGIGAQLHPNDPDFADRIVQPLIEGADREDPTTWAVILPYSEKNSEPSAFRDYWVLIQDGGSKHFMPTFNKDVTSREPDVKGDAWGLVPMSPEQPNSTRRGLPHAVEDDRPYLKDQPYAYPPEAGLSDFFETNPIYEATVKSYDWDLDISIMGTAPVPHIARETLDAEIMTMDEWHTADKPVGEIWVLDSDGWSYWAALLEPGEATGLLLNEMTYISPAIGTVYYAIYADAQMATTGSWELAFPDLTDEAEDLINIIISPGPRGISLMREGLVNGTATSSPFLTFPHLQRQEVVRVEFIDLHITDLEAFAAGTFNGRQVIAAADVTHLNSDYPVVAFYTESATGAGFDVYIAGYGGVAATGDLMDFFRNLTNATNIDVKLLDTSRVTSISSMFQDAGSLTGLDLSGWDTSNVMSMLNLFNGASSLTSLDLSGWNTSRVTNMAAVFQGARSLTSLDLSGWNTSRVTRMNNLFNGASSLTALDLSGWDTSRVTTMGSMFQGTGLLTTLDLYGFDTSRVTDMQSMFQGAGSLTGLDLSGWNTSSVTSMSNIFNNTSSLTSLDLSGWNTSRVTTMSFMFSGASSLTGLDLSGFDTSRVTSMFSMFNSTNSLDELDFRKATFGSVNSNGNMFVGSGINTIIVGSQAAEDFIQNAPGWASTPGRTIVVV